MKSSHNGLIRLVAVFKLLKAALLIITGFGILKLVHSDMGTQLDNWVRMCGLDPGSHYINRAIQKTTSTSPGKIKEFGFVSFIYAGLFLTEGIGLWMEKRWAEWFTVAITSSLVPVEVYEIYRHPTPVKVVVLTLNIAIVIYLLWHIRHESRSAGR